MVYKYTSIQKVIAKVLTDLDLKEGDHRISDMIEWAGEALEKIGSFPQFVNKVTGRDDEPLLEFEGYQTRLPFDFHRLIQIAYASSANGPFYPMRSATGSFELERDNSEATTTDLEAVAGDSSVVMLAMNLYGLTYEEAVEKLNVEPATRSMLNGMLTSDTVSTTSNGDVSKTDDLVYTITDSYIKTNVKSGYLMVAYQAIPTDGDGYPLVPDNQSFIDALYWYITMKMLYPQWAQGQVRDAVYYDARRSWNFHCKQAYGEAMMPNSDQMESIKNTWLKLVPEINHHDTFYSTLGQKEQVYNHHE